MTESLLGYCIKYSHTWILQMLHCRLVPTSKEELVEKLILDNFPFDLSASFVDVWS